MSILVNNKLIARANLGVSFIAALALVAGCTGDDGERGAQGPEGQQGVPGIPGAPLDRDLPTIDKAFAGAGGKAIVDTVTHFSYKAAGSRLISGEGFSARDSSAEASTFDVTVSYDIANDKLRVDWARSILFVGGVPLNYSDIIDGNKGMVVGDDDIFPDAPGVDNKDMTGQRWGTTRKEARLLSPHVILKEISGNRDIATQAGIGFFNGTIHELLEVDDSPFPVTLWVNAGSGEVSRITTKENDHLHRDVELEVHYADYQDHAGLLIPHEVVIVRDGQVLHIEQRSEFQLNPAFDATLFDFPAGATPPDVVMADVFNGELSHQFNAGFLGLGIPQDFFQEAVIAANEVPTAGSGVVHITGGSHHTMLVRQTNPNRVIVVEAPLYPERSEQIIAKSEELFPGVPITHVIATHHHEDHSAGLRAFVNIGATVVVQKNSEFFFREIFRAPSTISPDALAAASTPPAINIQTVADGGEFRLDDAGTPDNTVRAIHFDNGHCNDMLMIHVQSINAVFQSDLWNPDGDSNGVGLFPPFIAQFRDAIVAQNFNPAVTLLIGGHGATGTFADLDNKANQ